jgi:MoaA/NifB/PqqE/SkfB family radical SAM enzyme
MNCYADGDDMSIETVKNALDIFEGDIMTIGGGEPTIHPRFWEIFGLVVGKNMRYHIAPLIVTNGSMTDTAIALAALAKSGAVSASLSQDDYHDPIDPKVVQAFVKDKPRRYSNDIYTDCREIRDVTGREINAGRCNFGEEDMCPCNDFIIQPDGSVKICGCDDAPIVGNVNEGFDPSDWQFDEDHCFREWNEVYA